MTSFVLSLSLFLYACLVVWRCLWLCHFKKSEASWIVEYFCPVCMANNFRQGSCALTIFNGLSICLSLSRKRLSDSAYVRLTEIVFNKKSITLQPSFRLWRPESIFIFQLTCLKAFSSIWIAYLSMIFFMRPIFITLKKNHFYYGNFFYYSKIPKWLEFSLFY